jgi:hypothetical protein
MVSTLPPTVEGYFGLFKRGIYGTYHHIGKGYMQQYLNEFDFRYNNRKLSDIDRANLAIKAIESQASHNETTKERFGRLRLANDRTKK